MARLSAFGDRGVSEIVLLDTSVYLNVLDIPGRNQDRDEVLTEFQVRVENEDHFLLPLATVWETGNHIAALHDGRQRWRYASKLVSDVKRAVAGEVPYRPTHFPTRDEFVDWLDDFPDFARRNKSATRTREGVSLADMSIVKEWERTCRLHALSTVSIWSLDTDLRGYVREGN